jgi:hypothetical protein
MVVGNPVKSKTLFPLFKKSFKTAFDSRSFNLYLVLTVKGIIPVKPDKNKQYLLAIKRYSTVTNIVDIITVDAFQNRHPRWGSNPLLVYKAQP